MKEKFVAIAAVVLVFAAGSLFGVFVVQTNMRLNALTQDQQRFVGEVDKFAKEVQTEFGQLKAAQAPKK